MAGFSLGDIFSNYMQTKSLLQRQKLEQLAQQEREMRLAELQRQRDRDNKLQTSLASAFVTPEVQAQQAPMTLGSTVIPGGAATTVKGPQQFDRQALVGNLVNNGLGDVALQYQGTFAAQDAAARKAMLDEQKAVAEIGKTRAETGKVGAETGKIDLESAAKQVELIGQLANPIADLERQGADPQQINQVYQQQLMKAQQLGLPVGNMPPVYQPGIGGQLMSQAVSAKERLTLLQQKQIADDNNATQLQAANISAATQRRGQDLTDARAREANAIAAGNKQGNMTEGERNAGMFYSRATDAAKVLSSEEPKLLQNGIGQAWRSNAPNVWQTKEAQKYQQAKRQWIQAILRKDSGAVISDSEFKSNEETYFPVYGDGPETITRKQEARAEAEKALKVAAGRGAGAAQDVPSNGNPYR